MWALLVIITVSTGGVTSSVTYFADKASCEWQAAWLSTDMRATDTAHWVEHAYIHCMRLGPDQKGQ
jgi:hypothetical protein